MKLFTWVLCVFIIAAPLGVNTQATPPAPAEYSFKSLARSGETFDAFGFGARFSTTRGP